MYILETKIFIESKVLIIIIIIWNVKHNYLIINKLIKDLQAKILHNLYAFVFLIFDSNYLYIFRHETKAERKSKNKNKKKNHQESLFFSSSRSQMEENDDDAELSPDNDVWNI